MGDGIEILGWFVYFWLFIFSKKFRTAWVQEFKDGGVSERLYKCWEAVASILFGLAPLGLMYFVLKA